MELDGAFTIFLTLCFSCLLIIIAWKQKTKGGKLPPGPTPIPFLGNLLQVPINATFQSFMKLQKKYGSVFTVYLGPRPVVVLYGHETVKEALVDQADDFSDRGEMPIIERNFKGHGLAMSSGERWKILRHFSLTVLRNFGMGKRSIEERIQEEAGYLLEEIRKTKAKIHEEIKQVIGPHRVPRMDDRVKMPYTDAVIHEIQRMTNMAPMGIPRKVSRDAYFRGYFLPKGTDVYPLFGSVLKDPKYFCYPDVFYPQHFLDEQGRFKKNEAFVVYSSGKRNCVGESLARMELFLYFTSILQKFSLRSLVPPSDLDITPRISGFGNIAPIYELCFVAH